ncbi:amino acid adenylation domain-containing protein [Chroococcidiopsis sp. FACHB-1243]|uniref:non-ribosomal peptide synthetase n=1 Tax=Chroococcidiopsis sp. [FACHB-1243] TaxID=2692781 RepID=UPI001783C4E6|nr:non-ribosomal peptide synthetase [Chroococcidiopsis sp. [FACHB-1243]]MBD2309017.1 amino acid adenylation domain-containing protein [Chroococcidiopsis sp. [FACHB-1243]]
MKPIQEFLFELSQLDIRLWLDGDRLRCNAPKEAMTPALQAEIAERRSEIVQFVKQVNATSSTLETIKPIPRDRNLPLSFGQQGLWFIDQLEGGSAAYNQVFAIQLQGSVDVAVLEQALTEIIRRHEILRTTFKTIDGEAFQAIAPNPNFTLVIATLPREELQQLAITQSQRPFNLAEGSLLRVTLAKLAPEESVLLFVIHHAIADAWSSTIVMRELAALYQAFSVGKPSPLPELPIQYADFAYWQHQKLQQSLPEQLRYWEQKLSNTPPVLQLPSDYPRSPIQTFQGAVITLELDPDLTAKLKKLSQQAGVTLFITLLAAFNTLLYRYTNQDDLCIGTTIANRHSRELESLIGYFLNTLVMRTDLTGNPSFRELLQRVRDVAWEAYQHQNLPFDRLVTQLQPKRDLSHTPLFQVMFVLENVPTEKVELSGLTFSFLEIPIATANFDLSLSMRETQQGLLAKFEYNKNLFDAATITRMAGHFQTLLWAIVGDREPSISELPLLTEAERHQLLVEWNRTQIEYPQDKCIHQLFEAQVERTPEAVAVVFVDAHSAASRRVDKHLTYRELNHRANQVARYLRSLGVGTEVLVGICVDRSLDTIVGLLGILKAGGAYVPLDIAYPPERLSFMLSDAQVSVLLTQQKLLERLPAQNARIVCLDKDWEAIAQQSQENLVNTASSENLAYVIYTSGSTGQPKGVMIPHQSLVSFTETVKVEYGITKCDRVLQFASVSFDVAAEEIYPCITSGATLVLRTEEMLASVPTFLQKCRDRSLTILNLPTAYWHQWMAELETTVAVPESLRLVIIGGEPAHSEKVAIWQKMVGDRVQLINAYGLTETTVTSTIYKLPSAAVDTGQSIPIGRAIANVQTYVMDRHLQLVPVGVTGELYIGGANLARGYLHRADLTKEKFIPLEKSKVKSQKLKKGSDRLYKTGDLVRYLPDGNIEFLGRIDDQVKIRGFRIEIGEIEAVLSQHLQVKETSVIAGEDKSGNKRLVAYVVSKEQVSANELRGFLKEKLPDFMVPAAFVNLEMLPLTPNGKVDRRALPAPDTSSLTQETSFVPPRSTVELQLVQIWSEVLGVHPVGIRNNFFELGGDSILAIQIVAKANSAGIKLTTKQLFQHQTIVELATVAVSKQTIQAEQGLVTGLVPLTPIQHWFFEQNLLNLHHWNQAIVLEMPQVDLDLLEQVLQQLLLHHDALRLQFEQTQFGWQQIIDRDVAVALARFNFSGLTKAEQELAFQASATELQSSLNLAVAPLARFAVYDFGMQQPSRLLLTIHHLAVDMFSWRVLLEDLQTAYQQLDQGRKVELPAKTTSFKHWSEHLHDYAQSVTLQKEWDYWLTQLSDRVSLPVDFPGGENTVASERNVAIALSLEQTQALLQEVPQAYNTQINDVLLAALVQAFFQWTGRRSLLVSLESHGREEIFADLDLSRTVGWFTSIFPVLLNLGKSSHSGEALKAIKEQLRAIPNRGIGYSILRYLNKNTDKIELLRSLLQPEVSFNYLGQFDQTFSQSSLFKFVPDSSGLSSSPQNKRSELIEINGLVVSGQLRFNLTYSERTHQQSTIETLAQEFANALQALITHCQASESKSYTPSDFPELNLSQKGLDKFLAKLNRKGK